VEDEKLHSSHDLQRYYIYIHWLHDIRIADNILFAGAKPFKQMAFSPRLGRPIRDVPGPSSGQSFVIRNADIWRCTVFGARHIMSLTSAVETHRCPVDTLTIHKCHQPQDCSIWRIGSGGNRLKR